LKLRRLKVQREKEGGTTVKQNEGKDLDLLASPFCLTEVSVPLRVHQVAGNDAMVGGRF